MSWQPLFNEVKRQAATEKQENSIYCTPIPLRGGGCIGCWVPLGFVYLAASARLAGFDAEIYDARTKGHGYSEIEQKLRTSEASYIAVTAITASINDAIRVLEVAKSLIPKAVTILGGIHPTFCYEAVLKASSAVDYIIRGDGEATLRDLLLALENGKDPAELSGLAFRGVGGISKTSDRITDEDLENLPAAGTCSIGRITDILFFPVPSWGLSA
jgi:anaerobic magnesium-protoporphyrin IX monomethyl ester cyclase